ncbi:rCG59125 [Rattus norvegicus]|uniref:RCG59125 n=1 Tax=Rattus norvegicus TaxID=10116 RepID=A6JPS9_RAT|nr:rCG59125 [Rattus norvegicus]
MHELNRSTTIINEIDKTLDNMSSYRNNEWIVVGRLWRLKTTLAKQTGQPEVMMEGAEGGPGRGTVLGSWRNLDNPSHRMDSNPWHRRGGRGGKYSSCPWSQGSKR